MRNALAHELPDATGMHPKLLRKLRGPVDFLSQQDGVKGAHWGAATPFNTVSSVFTELSWWLYRCRVDRIAALGIQSPQNRAGRTIAPSALAYCRRQMAKKPPPRPFGCRPR